MANVYAVSAGNWSVAARWNTGSLPTSADDVYANGFAVTIDQDITVVSIQTRSNTGIAAGGSFTASTARTINASIYAGTSNCLTLSGTSIGTVTVNSTTIQSSNSTTTGHGINISCVTSNINITATNTTGASGSTAGNSHGIQCGGTSNTVVINSTNVTGGSSSGNNNYGINASPSAGNHNITISTTTISGGTVSSGNYGIAISPTVISTINISGTTSASTGASGMQIGAIAAATINITGNVNGASGGSNINGIITSGTLWTCNITGDVTGGSGGSGNYGIYHQSVNGTINVTGTSYGGVVAQGCYNVSTGTLRVKTTQASSTYVGLLGAVSGGITTFESAIFASNGQSPFAGFCKLKAGSNNYITCQKESGTLTLIDTANVSNGLPSASDVRLGTSYNFGNTTGTCAVPTASQVSSGIAVDNTTGTAVLTAANVKSSVWDIAASSLTTSNSIGERAKNMATTQDVGNLITSLI